MSKNIVYKVWVEIEKYNVQTGEGLGDEDLPTELASFDTLEAAQAFVQELEKVS